MVGPFLRETTILIVFCHIFVNGEDLLEIFHPNPSLPQELNQWLTEVQEHKSDFRLIRESLGEVPKPLFHLEDYDNEDSKNDEDYDNVPMKGSHNSKNMEGLEERPQNDIYPYMFQMLKDNDLYSPVKTTFKRERLASKNIKSPIRLRRSSNDLPFFEPKNPVNIKPLGKSGEIKRSDDKYPDSYSRNEEVTYTDATTTQKSTDIKFGDVKKREIQIDIKNDGKLVKEIHEDSKNPKSIVLNIQSPTNNPLVNHKTFDLNLSGEKDLQPNYQDLSSKIKNSPDSNVRFDNQVRNKEFVNNYNNLFTVNEHLNTDSSLARESTISHFHHMGAPDGNPIHDSTNLFHNYDTATTVNTNNIDDRETLHQNNFNNNNMKDMSSFWTAYEKNQMQKGLDRARINKNYLAKHAKPSMKNNEEKKVKEIASGFEPAQRIELDDDAEDNGDTRGISNIDDKNQMGSSKIFCEACNSDANGMNDPNCAACTNKLNSVNSANNLNLRGSSTLVSATDINNYNGLNDYDVNLSNRQENNKFKSNGNFNSLQGSPRINNKRQLITPEDNLRFSENDNDFEKVADFTTFPYGQNLDAQYITEVKRAEELPKNLFEKVYPLENDGTTTGLKNGFHVYSTPNGEETVEPLNLDELPKNSDELIISNGGIEPPINSNGEIGGLNYSNAALNEKSGHDLLDVKEKTYIDENENSSMDVEPIRTVESEVPNDPIDKVHEPYEENPLSKDDFVSPTQRHHSDKHMKTIVRKLHKDLKNDKRITEVETITEIDYPDAEDNEKEEPNVKKNEDAKENTHENEHFRMEEVIPDEMHHEKVPLINRDKNKEQENTIREEAEPRFEPKEGEEEYPNEEDIYVDTCDEIQTVKEAHNEKQNDHDKKIVMNTNNHNNELQHKEETQPIREEIHNPMLHENHHKNEVIHKINNFGNHHAHNKRKSHQHIHQHEPNEFERKRYVDKRKMFPYSYRNNYINDSPLSAELIIEKRDNSDEDHPRRRYKKRHGKGKTFFNDFDTQEYENILNEEENNIATSSSSNDLIPAFFGRQLKEVDYVFDPYLHRPGVNIDEELSTALEEIASEKSDHGPTQRNIQLKKSRYSRPLHKNSAEGDYSEEEDSVTEARRRSSNIIIKKTKNEFANPATTTDSQDYDNYDYDSISSIKKEKPKPKHDSGKRKKGSRRKGTSRKTRKQPMELKGHKVKNFAYHQKYKPKAKKKHPRFAFRNKLSPLHQSNVNKFSNQKFFDAKSDFQYWPSFVIDDQENEEKLRKRSPIIKKIYPRAFNFPLSSKNFFVKSQKRASNVKRENTNSPPSEENESSQTQGETATTEMHSLGTKLDSDEETDNCTQQAALTNVCEDKENFNKTSVQITTILSIAHDYAADAQDGCVNPDVADSETTNITSHERLDDILNGKLPFQLVDTIRESLSKNMKLKNRFHQGLKSTGPDTNFIKGLNATNLGTHKLIQSMTNIVNKLQFSATCQHLPHGLKHYLKTITRGAKMDALAKTREMEEVEFDENQSQENFIFQSSTNGDNFEGKVKMLQDLLSRFNKLPDKCKVRALPVKEYIENHLGMLNSMLSSGGSQSKTNYKPKKSIKSANPKSESVKAEDELIEEQLESLGLGKEHKFKPKFDLDQMVEYNKLHKASTNSQSRTSERSHSANVNKRDLNSVYRSKKYDKLVDAVRRFRLRREGKKRLAQMYGKSRSYANDFDQVQLEEGVDMSKANFESPLVFSL